MTMLERVRREVYLTLLHHLSPRTRGLQLRHHRLFTDRYRVSVGITTECDYAERTAIDIERTSLVIVFSARARTVCPKCMQTPTYKQTGEGLTITPSGLHAG
jgi:hypothetical protein